jgi:hypothetical protein
VGDLKLVRLRIMNTANNDPAIVISEKLMASMVSAFIGLSQFAKFTATLADFVVPRLLVASIVKVCSPFGKTNVLME